MARYGDLERLEQHFYNCADECRNTCDEWGAKCFETAMKATKNQPTADVVPKSEVDKTISEFAYLHAEVLNKFENARAEIAREIFEEIEREIKNHGITYAHRKIAELKKKYTESEK